MNTEAIYNAWLERIYNADQDQSKQLIPAEKHEDYESFQKEITIWKEVLLPRDLVPDDVHVWNFLSDHEGEILEGMIHKAEWSKYEIIDKDLEVYLDRIHLRLDFEVTILADY